MSSDATTPCPVLRPEPGLGSLFRPSTPNHPVLSAVLAGYAPGRVVVDDETEPRQALLRATYGFTFIGREVEQPFLERAVRQLEREVHVSLLWTDREQARLSVPCEPRRVVARLAYPHREDPAKDLLSSIPQGLAFQRMDAALLERCVWKGEIELACGSVDAFLAVGQGWCLMRDDEILSEAYAVFRGETTYEIGVVTSHAHRGCGHAPLACAKLIQACEAQGMATYWSCHQTNEASQRVAAKLGFRNRREYRFLVYAGD